jgi:signal transduction histidine kinase
MMKARNDVRDESAYSHSECEVFRLEERRIAILEERNRIAHGIHDHLAQGFAAILMQLQAAKREACGVPPAVAAKIDTAVDLARAHLGEARRSVGVLCAEVSGGESVAQAIRRMAALGQRMTKVHIDVNVEDLPRCGAAVERDLVAITREALANALRHARARHITIRASTVHTLGLRLSVADDGRGLAKERTTAGAGMRAMQVRAERIGAALTIVTAPRRGTEVVIAWEPPR